MNKAVLILSMLLFGCSPSAEQISFPVLPDGLKDCKFYLVTDGFHRLYVARCPHSDAAVQWQKR